MLRLEEFRDGKEGSGSSWKESTDCFIDQRKESSVFHRDDWFEAILEAYPSRACVLRVEKDERHALLRQEKERLESTDRLALTNMADSSRINGLLRLIHVKHPFLGNSLVGLPYSDGGGLLAGDSQAELHLLESAAKTASEWGARSVDLRQFRPLMYSDSQEGERLGCHEEEVTRLPESGWWIKRVCAGDKVRMLLEVPDDPEILMKGFKSKLRSQIRKPAREGLIAEEGGVELLEDFYKVFVENMRDLGSPVHAKKLFGCVLQRFGSAARLFIVYGRGKPMACGLVVGTKRVLCNPWASTLRKYSKLAPNMLLYWKMLEYACSQGYGAFDFGRSTAGEGTYNFKLQWGARPEPLFWYRLGRSEDGITHGSGNHSYMNKAMSCWKKMPTGLTKVIGPHIRRYISL